MTAPPSIETGVPEVLTATVTTWLLCGGIVLAVTLAGLAVARKISWAWSIGGALGVVIVVGTPWVVSWVRVWLGL